MPEQAVSFAMASGQHECTIFLAGPPPVNGSKANFETGFLRVMDLPETIPEQGVTIVIPSGAGPLVAAITDADGNTPEGVRFTVITPSKEILDQPTPITDTALFVNVSEEGSLRSLVVTEPEPGEWTIQVKANELAGEYYVIFYTTPTVDAYDTLGETAASMIDQDVYSAIAARVGSKMWSCKGCKARMWATAIGFSLFAIATISLTNFTFLRRNPLVVAASLVLGIAVTEFVEYMIREGTKNAGSASKWAEGMCRLRGDC